MKKAILFVVSFVLLVSVRANNDVFPVKRLGNTIYDGVFTGNGLLGSVTYLKANNIVRIDVGRTDVYDHRENNELALFDKARLPIGHFELGLNDTIQKATGEIAYTRGEAIADVSTAKMTFQIKTLTFSQRNLIYVEISTANKVTLPEDLRWIPEDAISPRMNFMQASQRPENYVKNPSGVFEKRLDVNIYKQPLLAGGGYATAWKSFRKDNKLIYLISVAYGIESDHYVDEVFDEVNAFSMEDSQDEFEKHRQFWVNYFEKSQLMLPDSNLQQFYNMQLYKLASATRQDKPAMDLQGPWTSKTPWPAYWHNLNIELAYSPTFASNHLEIASSLIRMIDRNVENLIGNVPEPYRYNSAAIGRSSAPDMISPVFLEIGKEDVSWSDARKELGNLTWILHSYYQYYRYSMDPAVYDRLFSLLKRAVNYYIHLSEKDGDGKYHIAVRTHSPEYSKSYHFDTNYDLSILKWGLKTLIALDNEREGKDPLHDRWNEILSNLRDYPKNSDGFMIAKDLPYAESHRHYSHLMMIYPFYDVNWDQVENRNLITKSITHWQSKDRYLQGYSFSGAASMYAMMGKGDQALQSIETLLRKYVKANTLYAEAGPVIETPLAAMASIQEMCLQYWNGSVRVFPAVPSSWNDVSFKNFLTDGAFLISASYTNGATDYIEVRSQHSGSISMKIAIKKSSVKIKGRGKILSQSDNQLVLFLEKGAVAKITKS